MGTRIYERTKYLCGVHGITIAKLEEELHFSNSCVKKWKYVSSPSVDKAMLIADYFNVSIDYLLGKTDIQYPASTLFSDSDLLLLIRAVQRMSDEDRRRMKAILRIVFSYAFSGL